MERATREGFRTIREAVRWCEEAFGVKVSEDKMGYWFRKWGIVRKVPRPMAEKADEKAQEEWKKRFMEALSQEGVKRGEVVVFVDEMRLGLLGQIRRRWVRRGIKLRQRVELRYEWRYLLLGVEALTGRLWWAWLERVGGKEWARLMEQWKAEGVRVVVWDNAAAHRARVMEAIGVRRVYQPPYSPEVNPVERLFEEIRRWVEGKVWGRIEAKQEAVEAFLQNLVAEGRVKSLASWDYIYRALQSLPQ